MGKHTPGPWAARTDAVGVWVVGAPTAGMLIAKIPAGSIDSEANARLLAAAPSLEAALEELLRHYATGHEQNPEIIQARAALALVKGGER